MSGTALTAIAPAKLNLSLSVTGRNRAGYHLLDSIVGFTPVTLSDRLSLGGAMAVKAVPDIPGTLA